MGLAGALIMNACLQIEETTNPNLSLMKEKKDGLDVYTPYVNIYNGNEIACPLCRYRFNEDEKKEIIYLLSQGKYKIIYLFDCYHNIILDSEIDIFDKLEKQHHKIELAQKDFPKFRYYKHCCLRNAKANFQNMFYIDLTGFDYSKVDFYHPHIILDYRYYYKMWKDDPELRATLKKEREEKQKRWENCELPEEVEGDW